MPWGAIDDAEKKSLEKKLAAHEKQHPPPKIVRYSNGEPIPEGFPIDQLIIPGGVAELTIHPDAIREKQRVAPPRRVQDESQPPA